MGKKRRRADGNVLAGKQFVGRHGPVEPKFRESSSGSGARAAASSAPSSNFPSVSLGTGFSDSDSDSDSDAEQEGGGSQAARPSWAQESEEDEEDREHELAMEIAALRAGRDAHAPEAEAGEMDAQPHLGNHAPGRSFRNDVPQMNTALESLVQRAPSGKRPGFVEILQVTGANAAAAVVSDVHDDLQREAAFYDHCLQGVKAAFEKLDALGLEYERPNDYYAEMIKSDVHMAKIKDKLLTERAKIMEKEEKRKQRDNRNLGKKVQAQREQDKHKKKQADLNSLKQWRSDRKHNRGDIGNEEALNAAIGGTYKKQRPGDQKAYNNSKYGFGGMKRKQKQNDRASADDMSGYSGKKNAALPRGVARKGNVRKKRPGKSRRN